MRTVIRDDVAGTVEGTHSDVPGIRKTLERPTPVNCSSEGRVLYLHDPAEFLWLIGFAFSGILYEPLRATLPPVFEGVDLSPMEPAPRARRDVEGNITDRYEDGSFLGYDRPHSSHPHICRKRLAGGLHTPLQGQIIATADAPGSLKNATPEMPGKSGCFAPPKSAAKSPFPAGSHTPKRSDSERLMARAFLTRRSGPLPGPRPSH